MAENSESVTAEDTQKLMVFVRQARAAVHRRQAAEVAYAHADARAKEAKKTVDEARAEEAEALGALWAEVVPDYWKGGRPWP